MDTIRSLLARAVLASAMAWAMAASPAAASGNEAPAPSPWAGLDPHLICVPGDEAASGLPVVA